MFPDETNMPIPLKYIDVQRITYTDINSQSEATISDYWPIATPRDLSCLWTGKVIFQLLRPDPGPHHQWIDGRLTKRQKTTRPDNIWPEVWERMGKSRKRAAIRQWEQEKPLMEEAQDKVGRRFPEESVTPHSSLLIRGKSKSLEVLK